VYEYRYNEVIPQNHLSAESVEKLSYGAGREELFKLLKKSLVIGGDTGKRSTFTLCYNFAL
jgi:hypothetical protein